jgi:hypothetical protein
VRMGKGSLRTLGELRRYMNAPADIIQFPVKRKRGDPRDQGTRRIGPMVPRYNLSRRLNLDQRE